MTKDESTRVVIDATTYGERISSVEYDNKGNNPQDGKIGPVVTSGYEATNEFVGRPLVIVTVGLPGRGKSYVSRRIVRFLSWLGLKACVFQVHGYRREIEGGQETEFFNHSNEDASSRRENVVKQAMADMVTWLRQGGKVGILDGQNVEEKRRKMIFEELSKVLDPDRIMFLEVGETNDLKLKEYKEMTLTSSSSFSSLEHAEASALFDARLQHYKNAYEPLEEDYPYIRMGDGGADLEINKIRGYVPCRVANFLMNVNLSMRPIFLSRHGQSQFNLKGKIGGDSGLTPFGEQYAQELKNFMSKYAPEGLEVWCSTLQRTKMTAIPVSGEFPIVHWRALEEIDAGIYDGWTYEEIRENANDEFNKRAQDKYWYRYPHGESYHDLVARLEPVIMELERSKKPLLIISHQAVLRVIYAYIVESRPEVCTNLSMPLHTVVQVNPTYGGRFEEIRHPILEIDPIEASVGTHGKEECVQT
eukprot:TRINITY_DN5291_c2_g1_i1.p1 TRINITY_DN5291_c2_g1~~TRINITY_DN5291_c2_g1_i1.p1  ORF type:complete len:475 (+),score=69.17 TRINITY_DN5291_c2_g1_i1:57-1481(+)